MWLEIIHIRTTESKIKLLDCALAGLMVDMQQEVVGCDMSLFRHFSLPGDLHLHLLHRSDSEQPSKTRIGQQIASAMKEFGMVNHTLWVMEGCVHGKTQEVDS